MVKNTLSYLEVQHIQQALARLNLEEGKLYGYEKNGNALIVSGSNFFNTVGMHAATQIGIEKGISVGSHFTSKKRSVDMPPSVIDKLFENELIVMSSERIMYPKIYGILKCKENFKPSK